MSEYLHREGKRYYYRRRVPVELRPYDRRSIVKVSLKTTSPDEAARLVVVYNDYFEAFWRDMLGRKAAYKDDDYKRAVALARAHGFVYKSAVDIDRAHITELLSRIDAAKSSPPDSRRDIATALLGGAERPNVLLSECFALYLPQQADQLAGKSDHQKRKWENPRRTAFQNFIALVGDKGLNEVTRSDALAFRDWWMEKVAAQTHTADTANKQIIRVRDVLRAAAIAKEMDIDFEQMFAKLKLKMKRNSREAYEAVYVGETLLAAGTLDGLNDDARWLIHAMADTGARPGELVGLRPDDILLDAEIPHIYIRPYNGHQLKTAQSERQIPLVGAALQAFQAMPGGFTRYAHADSLSALVNKYLTLHNLRPTSRHTLYSLRHTFKDRLRDAGAPEEIIDDLMGHEGHRPKYGRGHLLETKLAWMEKIAYKVVE